MSMKGVLSTTFNSEEDGKMGLSESGVEVVRASLLRVITSLLRPCLFEL